MAITEFLAAGNAALESGRWAEARTAFEAALTRDVTPESLVGLGQALWWLGETSRSVQYYQRAYAAYRREGDAPSAVQTALWISLSFRLDFGNDAAAAGWLARAERVLRNLEAGPLHGWYCLTRAQDRRDLNLARQLVEEALRCARDFRDTDLELCALAELGEILVGQGMPDQGLALIDEAMAGVFGGEPTRFDTVVTASCGMLGACEQAADLTRATQWCRVVDDFIARYGCPFLHGRCRIAFGTVLVAAGRWEEAERELLTAVRMTQDVWPALHARAIEQLAGLRVRQGYLEEAETVLALAQSETVASKASAALHLARAEAIVAIEILQRRLTAHTEGAAEQALTLELLVDALLADGQVAAAATIATRLAALAGGAVSESLRARGDHAIGRVKLAQGDTAAAIGHLESALARFVRLELPFEAGRVRLELARSLASGNPEIAILEGRAALEVFERLGARPDADQAAAFLRSLGARGRSTPGNAAVLTPREYEVLRLIGLGLSNPEIAQRLVITRKTASHHVSSILAKLGVRNRAEAATRALRLISPSAPR